MERVVRKISALAPVIPKKKRVAAYARVSSGKDAMLHSLSAQVSYYSDYIQKHREWQFAGVYADEALTGTKDDRAEFQRLLNDCRDGKIDMVITKSISRFARNTVTMLETLRELKLINVDVYFEKENIHSISGDGELMLTILASFAQAESLSVSENCKWRIRKRFQAGEIANLRFMYGYNIKKGEITVDHKEAEIVRMIFADYISGMGCENIASKLNQLGLRTFLI
jgi:site-specific DNA recombinase